MSTTENILDYFKAIAKPFTNDVGGEKEEAIHAFFEEKGLSCEYIQGVGLIVNKQENPRVVLVSHMDLVPPFNRGFSEGRDFNIVNDMVVGALDNTLTNACAMHVFSDLIKSGVNDVELFFSEWEEAGLRGMRAYLQMFNEKSENTFFVNLDVTNDGWGKHMSIEFDRPNSIVLEQTKEALSHLDPHIQFSRFTDDTSAIVGMGFAGYSFCIPTLNYCHSYDSSAKVESIEPYCDGLYSVLKSVEKPTIYELDI